METDRRLTFSTPAKINFYLKITGKRDDGYHELLLDLIPISLFDRIEIAPSESGEMDFICESSLGDPQTNLVVRAVRLLEKETGRSCKLKIKLTKKIPVGAGLGGGSGNAGGVLRVFNRLFDLKIKPVRLAAIARQLGADVPFFLNPTPSRAWGIGTDLSPVKRFDPISLIVIYPKIAVSTQEAYQNCKITKRNKPPFTYDFAGISRLEPGWNDFWGYLSGTYPMLEQIRILLREEGALGVGLSGSGSAMYGIFEDKSKRDQVLENLKVHESFLFFSCETLTRYRYPVRELDG